MQNLLDLRDPICDALYQVEPSHLLRLCKRLGLAPGGSSEVVQSKRNYLRKRLDTLDGDRLREVATQVEREHPHYALAEALARIDELGQPEIGEITRRRIIQLFRVYSLVGDLDDLEFIKGVWPLDTMVPIGASLIPEMMSVLLWSQSKSYAVRNNRVLSKQWSDEKLLFELEVLTCSRRQFTRMIEATVHPRTRGEDERARLVEDLNGLLLADGWALKATGRTSGLPIYTVQPATPAGEQPADAGISDTLASFDQDGVHAAWKDALALRAEKPEAAITAARTLIETVCKHILAHDPGVSYDERDDLPKLYRLTAKSLNLAPDQHSAEAFRMVLGGCFSVVEGLGTLRNKLGNAHGKSPEQAKLQARPKPRHAELAVNLAGAMAMFLVSTWVDRQHAAAGTADMDAGAPKA